MATTTTDLQAGDVVRFARVGGKARRTVRIESVSVAASGLLLIRGRQIEAGFVEGTKVLGPRYGGAVARGAVELVTRSAR